MASIHHYPHHSLHHRRKPTQHTDPLVFAHYMICFQPPNGDYKPDILLAQAAGIDAFAINYGAPGIPWPDLEAFLDKFYHDAASLHFKVFMSYDLEVLSDPTIMVNTSNTYLHHPAQLWVDNKIFLSSFATGPPPFSWQHDVLDKIAAPVMFMPGTIGESARATAAQFTGSGPFTWIHPASSVQQEAAIDNDYSAQREVAGVPWMAGVAPWFFKRMPGMGNWMHAQDDGIWYDRWMHLLDVKPNFIELVTWNDFGESSYVGPVGAWTGNKQAQSDCFYGGLNHTAFLSMTKFFTRAFKSGGGNSSFSISPAEEDVYFFYRLQPAASLGGYGGMPLPKNAKDCKDTVTVLSFLAEEATVTLASGGANHTINFPKGVNKQSIPFNFGDQSLSMDRPLGGGRVLNKKGPPIVQYRDAYTGNVNAI
ncbi:uncharacterized protein KY384_007821 [Bacidia gigantensis]|uniref:uncharacterized protein n=1 Tax=Bacidia gigantensis TaxID=2732470 RepID=UPI001D03EBB3|nr:uncharacterized protein KY384_007821 [Bacidia gigantensis]KAG8527668.1 hypothetical protein KY384_007821 [Bacidia gigantensis]